MQTRSVFLALFFFCSGVSVSVLFLQTKSLQPNNSATELDCTPQKIYQPQSTSPQLEVSQLRDDLIASIEATLSHKSEEVQTKLERLVQMMQQQVPATNLPPNPATDSEPTPALGPIITQPASTPQLPPFADYARDKGLTLDALIGDNQLERVTNPDELVLLTSNEALDKYFALLEPYIRAEPPAPLTVTTPPTPLPDPSSLTCQAAPFTGRRDSPAKVVDLIGFGYELDTLEVRLWELDSVVDEFIIWESHYTQRGNKKPIFFDEVRFAHFKDKVVRLVDEWAPPALGDKPEGGSDWRNEGRFRDALVEEAMKRYGEDAFKATVFLTSDLDEIPSAEVVQLYKVCNAERGGNLYKTFLHKANDIVRPMLPQQEKGYWVWGGIRMGHELWNNVGNFRGAPGMYEGPEPAGYHLSRIHPPVAYMFKWFAMAETRMQVTRKCADYLLDPVKFWWHCVIRDRVEASQPGWTSMGMDNHPLKRFDEWSGPHGKQRPWLMEMNKARYPWAWVSTMEAYVKANTAL